MTATGGRPLTTASTTALCPALNSARPNTSLRTVSNSIPATLPHRYDSPPARFGPLPRASPPPRLLCPPPPPLPPPASSSPPASPRRRRIHPVDPRSRRLAQELDPRAL